MDATALARANAPLKALLAEVEVAPAEEQEANRRLEAIPRRSQREKFGKRSETLSPEQFSLALEDAELAQGVLEAARRRPRLRCNGRAGKRPASRIATVGISCRTWPGLNL